MDNALQPNPPEADPAAAVFAQLVEEVGVVRRLVAANDNSATLGEIVQRLDKLVEAVRILSRRPAMTLTPDQMAEQIAAAAVKARAEDHAAMKQAREQMEKSARLMDSHSARAVTAREQRRHLTWTGGGCLFSGTLLWSFLPGTIARGAPTGWHWPERMAAHVLRLDRWSAGERLLATADPEHWRAVVLGNSIVQDNQEVIAACLRQMRQTGKAAQCRVRIAASW
jgi:hypothetical protein